MRISAFRMLWGTAASLVAIVATSTACRAGHTGYAYVGDVRGNQVIRFDDQTGAQVAPTPYIHVARPEGVGGTNTLLIVASSDKFINVYNSTTAVPTLLEHIATPNFDGLKIAVAPDAQSFYVAGNDQIRQYSLGTGAELGHVTSPDHLGNWGVAVNPLNGRIYWTTGWDNNNAHGAIYSVAANLAGSITTVEAPGAHGATRLVGLSFRPDGSFYAVNGVSNVRQDNFVNHYNADGTFRDRLSLTGMPANALIDAFDTEVGPGGYLFVTSLSGACAVKFNPNDTYNSIFIPPHAAGLQSAKTIHFSINNVVPEPSSLALAGLGALLGLGLLRRRISASA